MPFSGFDERVAEARSRIAEAKRRGGHGQQVRLIAVTKTHGPDAVEAVFRAGIVDVGENKVQEAIDKQAAIAGTSAWAADIRWHLIGHLQRNKVRHLDRFCLLHAMDRASLADEVHGFGVRRGRPMDVLVQVNVAGESTKGGYEPRMWDAEAERLRGLSGLRVIGVMTMAPFDADEATLRRVFSGARDARAVLAGAGHAATELSMGMSGDFEIAVEEGATMVRLGTVLFGARG
jgi:pyridoxal phosphate enzyme (YggS family)